VIEVKGTGDDARAVAATPQVAKYLERYGQVLVTNLRDFILVGRGADGAAQAGSGQPDTAIDVTHLGPAESITKADDRVGRGSLQVPSTARPATS